MKHLVVSAVHKAMKLAVMPALSIVFVFVSSVQAAPIAIQNYSFEMPSTPPDQTWFDGIPTSWTGGPAGIYAFVEQSASVGFTGGNGAQYAGIGDPGYLYQDLGVPFAPFTTYTIDIASAHRGGFNHSMLNFGLFSSDALDTDIGTPGFADIQGIWPASEGNPNPNPDGDGQYNQLRDASVLQTIDVNGDGMGSLGHVYTYTTGATPPTGNLVVFIRQQGTGDRVNVDNIRLDASAAVPEPGTILLFTCCAFATAIAWRNQKRR